MLLSVLFCTHVESLSAQGLSISGGASSALGGAGSSYSWSVDYQQRVGRNLAWSVSWINEGHFDGHHRDGFAGQLWGVLPLAGGRFDIEAGIGLYNWFDTQSTSGATPVRASDEHDLAAIYSVAAIWHTRSPWFFCLAVNRIGPIEDADLDTITYTAGVGYWFGAGGGKTGKINPAVVTEVGEGVPRNEITVLAGTAVVNLPDGQQSFCGQLEYRRLLSAHTDWTVSYLNEGTGGQLKRNGFVTQLWLAGRFLDGRLQVGFGAGVYWTIESSNEVEGWRALSGIVSPTLSYRFSEHWLARVTWNRVMSSYDRDADNFLAGVGYAW